MSGSPTRFLKPLRRITLLLAAAGACYLMWRFDVYGLPGECSPVRAVPAGARMVVDMHPSVCEVGDLVFYEHPETGLEFGRVVERCPDHASVATDNEQCVSPSGMGPHTVPIADVAARVVFVLGAP